MSRYAQLLLGTLLVLGLFSCSKETSPTVNVIDDELQVLIDDMLKSHEGVPNGVGTYDWGKKPRVGYGNNPPAGWNAMIPWGQVYTDEIGNTATNTRFQIRNLQTWYLSKSQNRWIIWKASSDIEGANYAEDFQDDDSIEADIRSEIQNEGGISATLVEGYNYHFWNRNGRTEIVDPTDIAAVWSAVDARLILDDENGPDDRSRARLMMSVGADYWKSADAQWDQWKTNGDIFIGRFRYMTNDWQRFHAHSLSSDQILYGPLPPYLLK